MTDSGAQSEEHAGDQGSEATAESSATVWILVDRSARQAAFETVAERLGEQGVDAQIVTITEVIGSVARDALTGGAERLLRGLRVAFQGRTAEEDLLGAVKRARPDVLAVTNPRYGKALNLVESLAGIRTLQVGILPDFNLSADWINSSLQAFVVPTDEHRKRLVANGFLAERVLVAAPAIQTGFSQQVDRDEARKQLGFGEEKVVLVRGDGFAPNILEKLVFQATLVENGARFIFHHNGDSAAAAALRRAADQYGLPAAMFGKVADLERFVAASDLVLAPTSEPYVADVLAQGRPLLLVGAEEQGAAQAEFLSEAGAARHVVDVLRLGSEIERALDDETLQKTTEAAQSLGAPDGSEQVARALTTAVEHSDEWLSAPAGGESPEREEPPVDDQQAGGEQDEHTEAESAGPFESIGTGKSRAARTTGEAGGADAKARREPSFSGISAAEAKEQLAELILMERELERKLAEIEKQQERWRNRLELAREWNEQDLADEAKDILRGYLSDAEAIEADLVEVRRQKDKLKRAAGHTGAGKMGSGRRALPAPGEAPEGGGDREGRVEGRFRDLELDRDLDDLKDKIRRDLGD
jgi:hypothetical protein